VVEHAVDELLRGKVEPTGALDQALVKLLGNGHWTERHSFLLWVMCQLRIILPGPRLVMRGSVAA